MVAKVKCDKDKRLKHSHIHIKVNIDTVQIVQSIREYLQNIRGLSTL